MAIVRSYVDGFAVTDRTDDLLMIPNKWGLLNQLGLFKVQGVAEHTLTIEQQIQTFGLMQDVIRGQRAAANRDYKRKLYSFPIPNYTIDDHISPSDMQGLRAFGADTEEQLAPVRTRKLESIRNTLAATLEYARCQAITAGTVYAPNGTVDVDWYRDFGVTRTTKTFTFSNAGEDQKANIEAVLAEIQDKQTSGEIADEVVFICSPGWFSALTSHPKVIAAYQFYSSTQELNRNRLTAGGGLDYRYRDFVYSGARFIEYRGSFTDAAGSSHLLIPANEAYALPLGTMDSFFTYYGPAYKTDLVNTIGREAYFFEYNDPKGSKIDIEAETSFINVLRRPAVVIKCVLA